jgi:hypothetical protein
MTEAAVQSNFVRPNSGSLTPKDAQILLEGLVQGDQALARRKDLGEMYKRIVAMLTTLETGLSERQTARADQERSAMSERLDQIERSVNGVEGVLRIEMDQLIRRAIGDSSVGQPREPSGRRAVRRVMHLAVLCTAVLAGAVFSDQIHALDQTVRAMVVSEMNAVRAPQSPDGGSPASENQVK